MATSDYLGMMQQGAQRLGGMLPIAMGLGGTGIVAGGALAGGNYLLNQRRNDPNRLGQQGANVDQERLARASENWSPEQMQTYSDALNPALERQVRTGQIDQAAAQNMAAQGTFSLTPGAGAGMSPGDYGGMGEASGPNLPAAQGDAMNQYGQMYGNPNDIGLPDAQQFGQMQEFALAQGDLQQQLGNQAVAGEADRAWKYNRPLERDRNYEGFAMQQAGESNAQKRQMAMGLLNQYAQTSANLIGSGLR